MFNKSKSLLNQDIASDPASEGHGISFDLNMTERERMREEERERLREEERDMQEKRKRGGES